MKAIHIATLALIFTTAAQANPFWLFARGATGRAVATDAAATAAVRTAATRSAYQGALRGSTAGAARNSSLANAVNVAQLYSSLNNPGPSQREYHQPHPPSQQPNNQYVGAVGRLKAVFSLTWNNDGSVTGAYFNPTRDSRQYYSLEGFNISEGVLELNEYTDDVRTARIHLKKQISPGWIVWSGKMFNADGRVLDVSIQRER